MIRYIDAHTHAQFPAFDADRAAVIERARAAGVAIVNVGTTRETSEAAIAFAEGNPNAYAVVGVHPSHATGGFLDVGELGASDEAKRLAKEGERFDEDLYRRLALHPKVVAIGECGLDYYRLPEEGEPIKVAQRDLLLAQIKLAFEVGKPLMIHCREAMSDLIELLTNNSKFLTIDNPGIIHFFTGTIEEARSLAALGFSFTFGGVVTFAREYDEVIRFLPPDRILSETDAPYVAPAPYRGKRNEPAYVVEVAKKLAEIQGADQEVFRVQLLKNAERVFGISLGSK